MDFRSLTRKELQALCKKNKIPANITNLAMADALAALDTVEGLEELLNQSQSVPESPAMPRTVTRTSTRRKPIKEEPETAQPTTRTRGRTRRVIDQDLDQENKNMNVKMETPAMPASRRRAPAAETPAVRTGYSTRRSVRLLENSLAELSLKEAVKMDVLLDETEEKHLSENLEKDLKDEVHEKSDNVSGLDAKEDSSIESSDQLDKTGPVDALVAEFTSESEKDHNKADEAGDDECVLLSDSPTETENASAEVIVTENVPDEISTKVAAAEVHLEEEDLELPFDPDSWETDSNQSLNNDSVIQKSVLGKDAEESVEESFVFDNVRAPNGSENLQVEMEESSASEGLIDVNLNEGGVAISPRFAKQRSPTCPSPSENEAKGHTSEIELISEDNAEDVVESKKDMSDDVYVMPSQEYDDLAANLPPLPDTPPSGEKSSPCHPVSVTKIPQMSLLGADTIATQFPRPTQSTPVKSSSKKQTTDEKATLLLADNKENIDNSGMQMEPKKEKVKKKNIIDVDSLNEKSLRELTKMFKEKVKIHNKMKNVDEEQVPTKQTQVGKTRPALQKLTENVMVREK